MTNRDYEKQPITVKMMVEISIYENATNVKNKVKMAGADIEESLIDIIGERVGYNIGIGVDSVEVVNP